MPVSQHMFITKPSYFHNQTIMGLSTPSAFTYHLRNVSLRALLQIIRARITEDSPGPITVDVDCSWVAYKALGPTQPPTRAPALVFEFMRALASVGFTVFPICDGDERHHSKRASTDRLAKKEKSRIDSILLRCKMLSIAQNLQNETIEASAKETLAKELKIIEKKVISLEKRTASGIPSSFVDDLKELILVNNGQESNEHGGFIAPVMVASFQADTLIARRAIKRKNHLIDSENGNGSDEKKRK